MAGAPDGFRMDKVVDDPRDAEVLEWDEHNEAKIARHGVSTEEIEQLWQIGPVVLPNRADRSGLYKLIGRTAGGRPLVVTLPTIQFAGPFDRLLHGTVPGPT